MDATGVGEGKWHCEKRTFYRILRNELHLRKIAARWVPHALTEVQRWLRYAICIDLFAHWKQDGDRLLSRIITIDEFWARTETSVHGVTTCWINEEAEGPSESFPVKSMVIVTYDVRRGVPDKRPDLGDSEIILHDNARSHEAECVRQLRPTFRPMTLTSFPRLRNQYVVGGLQHERT
ncbi:histone-lysine N-methyltransferase SETMAR [Trichonephila clavipes]|nr:histone-lysine N-methyltransferase SETMAR [Trichonephila clavipes]